MGREYEPTVGQWYEDLENEELDGGDRIEQPLSEAVTDFLAGAGDVGRLENLSKVTLDALQGGLQALKHERPPCEGIGLLSGQQHCYVRRPLDKGRPHANDWNEAKGKEMRLMESKHSLNPLCIAKSSFLQGSLILP